MAHAHLLLALTCAIFAPAATSAAPGDAGVQPAVDLVTRNYGAAAAASLVLSVNTSACGLAGTSSPCFVLSQAADGRVAVSASSMSELTYGIGYYARFHCGLTVGWKRGGGSYTAAGSRWPCHGSAPLKTMAMSRAVPYTYQDNVCTHSYSYAFYDEADWTAHIDWMALSGINVFLAMTGQEEVQYKTFRRFGLKDRDIREFFNGPAYLTWSRGQSMQSVGSSAEPEGGMSGLPRSWMQSQWALQKKILALTRPLGIIGVLPAFQGNMPPQIKAMHPGANISLAKHQRPGEENATKGNCAWVASTDPLFGQVADVWMETLVQDFGTDHWYQCDGFFTGAKPPWYQVESEAETELSADGEADNAFAAPPAPVKPDPNWTPVWKAAWEGMSRTDPEAKWLYQGWAIRGWNDAAGASRIRALYEAVPHGQWVPLDMAVSGIWRYWGNYSFFGAPFIWTTLHNMGGNDGMKGDLRLLEGFPRDAIAAKASIIGTGATPEGIDQNPMYYEYTYDTAWHAEPQPLDEWFAALSSRRYGNTNNADSAAAWHILSTAVYNSQAGGWHDDTGVEWTGLGNPPSPAYMNTSALFRSWGLLTKAGAALDPTKYETLNYDIVNVGREVLAQVITAMEHNLTQAVAAVDKAAAMATGTALLAAYADLDKLLGCDYGFLLGPWIRDARKWANASDGPASYYEWQARSQVTTWWPVAPSARNNSASFKSLPILDNYANKHWNGLVRDFYAKRVQCYINQADVDLPATRPNGTCEIESIVPGTFLAGYPKSLGSGGVHPPSTWPYDTSSLSAAASWCCQHADCGGVTHQNGRYEVRAGSTPQSNPSGSTPADSYPRDNCAPPKMVAGTYLAGYPKSLGSGGVEPPATWPYDTSSLSAAASWCCQHADCGGVTHQNGRYEVRAGGCAIPNPGGAGQADSYPKAGACKLNPVNLTKCVTTAEMDFTQDSTTKYIEDATTGQTVALSTALMAKYRQYIA